MAIIINIKNKKKEKAVKDFLTDLDVEFQTIAEKDAAIYKTAPKKSLTVKEKKILNDIEQAVEFVNKYKKGKVKAKSFNKLLNEL